MAETNAQIIRNEIARYKTQIFDEVEKRCIKFCDSLCHEAIVDRQYANGAHDYTGNLLNSIVVCLYREQSPIYACYAADRVSKAIQVKMTTPGRYRFRGDYDGSDKSTYVPLVATNQGWGEDDARKFFQSYRPNGRNLFEIIVAYPVEYADWIESHRKTTGILATYDHAAHVGVEWLKLPRVYN